MAKHLIAFPSNFMLRIIPQGKLVLSGGCVYGRFLALSIYVEVANQSMNYLSVNVFRSNKTLTLSS